MSFGYILYIALSKNKNHQEGEMLYLKRTIFRLKYVNISPFYFSWCFYSYQMFVVIVVIFIALSILLDIACCCYKIILIPKFSARYHCCSFFDSLSAFLFSSVLVWTSTLHSVICFFFYSCNSAARSDILV